MPETLQKGHNKRFSLSEFDLQSLVDSKTIDESDALLLAEKMREKQVESALKEHDNKIWQNKTTGYYMTYIRDADGRRKLLKKRKYADIVTAITGFADATSTFPTFKMEYDFWINDRVRRGRIKKATQKRYDEVHSKYFSKIDNKHLDTLKPYDYESFLENSVSEFNLTSKAYFNMVTILRGVLRLAKRQGWIDFSIDEMIADADVSDKQFRKVYHSEDKEVFNEEETAVIVPYLKSHCDLRNSCILLMFVTGIRVGEAVVLKPENVEEKVVHIRATESRYLGRNGKVKREISDAPKTEAGIRDVVVPPAYQWLTKSLMEQSQGREYVFEEKGIRFNTDVIRGRLRRVCVKLGIVPKSPHKIRKTYASILLDNGVDTNFAIKQMGHAAIEMTEEHYHRDRKSLEEKENILSNIADFK